MWYEKTDIIFGLRASIFIEVKYFLCYRKIMLASVISFYSTNCLPFVMEVHYALCKLDVKFNKIFIA
jgi:hypothetical protein